MVSGWVRGFRPGGASVALTLSSTGSSDPCRDGRGASLEDRFRKRLGEAQQAVREDRLNRARVGADAISLVLPEWHPSRTVSYPRRLAPGALAGCWLELTADLGQAQAAALNPAEFCACGDPGGERCHRPDPGILQEVAVAGERPRPSLGRGCDDIVLEAAAPRRDLPGGAIEFHVAPHVQLHSGGRLYLPGDGTCAVTGYLDVVESEPTPNGTRVRCLGTPHPVDVRIPLGGPLLSGRWRWRWWPRELEHRDCVAQPTAFRYDAVKHCDDIRWAAPGHHDAARGLPAGCRDE
jgi:hypothetical protein